MTDPVFTVLGGALVAAGFAAFVGRRHPLWKVLALNVLGSGVFLLLLTLSARADGGIDPVPQAMVLTGIVVTVAATALALGLAVRIASHGEPDRDGESNAP